MLDGFLDLFEPVNAPDFSNAEGVARIADRIEAHRFDAQPMLEGARVALFGVNDGRRSGDNEGCAGGADAIRHWLYQLVPPAGWQPTVDLGDIRSGATEEDTYAAVQSVVAELVQMGIIPIVLGGGHDLTIPMYAALESVGRPMNLVTVDPRLDFGGDPSVVSARNHMNSVVMHEPNYLFDYANIGHQGYMTDPDTLELLERLQFEAIRLGTLLQNIQHIEPVVRNADLITVDVASIRASDHPASTHASPNGMTAEHFCQLSRYIGMSDRLLATGFFEHNPDLDDRGRGGHLVAQGVWHVLDGIYNQKGDHPKCSVEDYLRYVVDLPGEQHEIAFFKSPKSDRWWMDVPMPHPDASASTPGSLLVPCTHAEYVEASEGSLPDRWWRTFQKLA
ncbi:formimidoylglutamase [Flavobacteriales bacterium]|nr:formimidoylglutamase [Flavobacteriales bacterium]